MVYKKINSKLLIGTTFEAFNIDYSGFVSRVPNYIHNAMRELDIYVSHNSEIVDVAVADYKVAIPDECKILDGVSYFGKRLDRTDKMNQNVTDNMANLTHSKHSYQPDKNGYLIMTYEECDLGDTKLYIQTLPIELDTVTNLYFPLIPDNRDLIVALQWYILKSLLERGHKIRNYSLAVNNIYLNPGMAWDKYASIARNSVSALDADDRHTISNMINTFLVNQDYYYNEAINNKYVE